MGGGGSGLKAAAGSWALPLSPVQHPLSQRGAQGGWWAPRPGRELGPWEGMDSIRKARKITPTVKPSSVGRIQLLLSAFHRRNESPEGQELARRHTAKQKAAGSRTQAHLEGRDVGTHSWA